MSLHPCVPRPLLLVVLVAASTAGCSGSLAAPEEETPEAPVHAQPARKVVLGEWTELLGTTQPLPNHSASISAVLEGHVESVLRDGRGSSVREGQQVEAGQIIVKLND